MSPIWTSNDVDILLLRLSSSSRRPYLDSRRYFKLYGLDLMNWSLLDQTGTSWAYTILSEDREPAFLVSSPLLLRMYGLDLPGWIWLY
ncbi:hypothetical protein TNCV_4241141 [Trichonephila clavipes]|nr:hypothetical protein TNCV_4241141 [Trichonephila clavipes]